MVRARTRTIREHHPQCYQQVGAPAVLRHFLSGSTGREPASLLQLCEKSRTSAHPASRQIDLDLHRTLTTNQRFCSPSSPALPQLRRILLAFSWRNPAIGYCQGLNRCSDPPTVAPGDVGHVILNTSSACFRLAAIALLILQSEEDAFWCLVAVVEAIMPQDYYTKSLVASQVRKFSPVSCSLVT